ncbi:MAG TPA: AAA family ATPase, partial [Actinomycetota bacterium]|nr:AAA family ATPase [Actinomycetota bacterium]
MPVCANCGEDNPARGRFCLACGTALHPGSVAPSETRRVVTIVFVDVVGSTSLAERLDPEPLRLVMRRYFDAAREAFEGHGGTVQKFIGDAVMAVFGIPKLHEDDALRAVRAADSLRHSLQTLNGELADAWGVELAVRTGINTGEVVVGTPEPGHALVLGDPVNVAARLERIATPGQIILGLDTYRLVARHVDADRLPPRQVEGKAEEVIPHAFVRLVEPVEGAQPVGRPPMIGRDRELGRLREAFDDVVRRSVTRLVTVMGPPGIGKSRLVEEFRSAVGPAATVLTGRCLPYGDGITFWPVLEVIRAAADVLDDDAPEAATAKIGAAVASAPDAERIATQLSGLLGIGEEVATLDGGFWAVRRFLEVMAQRRPVVVVFDDVHAAEPRFLDLVDYLVRLGGVAPLLIVCPTRPEIRDHRPEWIEDGGAGDSVVALAPLTTAESEDLIQRMGGSAELPTVALHRIAEAAEGNPLFVGEMLRKLVDDGLLQRRAGGLVATDDLSAVSVPPTIQALLAARLDALTAEERAVAERAAVVGKVFDERTVWFFSPDHERAAVGTRIQSLVRRELVQPEVGPAAEPGTYRFSHILIRDAAYQAMLKQARADLHERFALWLDTRAGERPEEEIVAYHLEQAYRLRVDLGPMDDAMRSLAERAARHLGAAGRRALARGDIPAAISLLDRAAAIDPDEDRRLAVIADLSDALTEEGQFAQASELARKATEEAERAGDEVAAAHARIARVKADTLTDPQGRAEEERDVAQAAITVFESVGDDLGLARAWHLLARAYNLWGRMEDRREALERAIEHAQRAGARRDVIQIQAETVSSIFNGPTPVSEGLAWCERLLSEAETSSRLEASIVNAQAGFYAMQGDFERGRAAAAASERLFTELGMTVMAAITAQDRSFVESLARDHGAAEAILRRGYEALERMGERSYQSSMAGILGHTLVARDRLDEAEEFGAICRRLAASDDLDAQLLWRGVRARVLARRGELEEAERLARAAMEMVGQTDFWLNQADCLRDLAEVLRARKRTDEARELAAEAVAVRRRKGDV